MLLSDKQIIAVDHRFNNDEIVHDNTPSQLKKKLIGKTIKLLPPEKPCQGVYISIPMLWKRKGDLNNYWKDIVENDVITNFHAIKKIIHVELQKHQLTNGKENVYLINGKKRNTSKFSSSKGAILKNDFSFYKYTFLNTENYKIHFTVKIDDVIDGEPVHILITKNDDGDINRAKESLLRCHLAGIDKIIEITENHSTFVTRYITTDELKQMANNYDVNEAIDEIVNK
uniref:Uncharacterized protein n=1 Tax=Panagrolaimus sp. ES5 TaxID=591445 RepID=A0AC34GHY0_9BILA